ncbi:MAG: hypothetical protein ACQETX_08745, partial [Pseudomonadota bacterium]
PDQLESAIHSFAERCGLLEIKSWTRERVQQVTLSVVERAKEASSNPDIERQEGCGRYKLRRDTILTRLPISGGDARCLGLVQLNPDPLQREDRKRDKNRKRKRLERRRKGQQPRDKYLASSTTVAQPWLQIGMSRSGWYRKGKNKDHPPKVANDPGDKLGSEDAV